MLESKFTPSELVPGLYDTPKFARLEGLYGHGVVEAYARYVMTRKFDQKYATKTRAIVTAILHFWLERVKPDELLSKCFTVTAALMRCLEAEGIWCFVACGSLIAIPHRSAKRKTLLAFDQFTGLDGHAWLVVPPFVIVDITAKTQRYRGQKVDGIPALIALEVAETYAPDLNDYAEPENHHRPEVRAFASNMQNLLAWLPANRYRPPGVELQYCPVGVTLPASDSASRLAGFPHLTVGGETVSEFYNRARGTWSDM